MSTASGEQGNSAFSLAQLVAAAASVEKKNDTQFSNGNGNDDGDGYGHHTTNAEVTGVYQVVESDNHQQTERSDDDDGNDDGGGGANVKETNESDSEDVDDHSDEENEDVLSSVEEAPKRQHTPTRRVQMPTPVSLSKSSAQEDDYGYEDDKSSGQSKSPVAQFGSLLVDCYGHRNFSKLSSTEKAQAYTIKDLAGLQMLYAYLETHTDPGGTEFQQMIGALKVNNNQKNKAGKDALAPVKSKAKGKGKPKRFPGSAMDDALQRVLNLRLAAPMLPSHSGKFVRDIASQLHVEDETIWTNIQYAQEAVAIVLKDAVSHIPDVRKVRVDSVDRFLAETGNGRFDEYSWSGFVDVAVRLSGLPNANYHPWDAARFHGAWKGFCAMPELIQNLLDEMCPGKTLQNVDNDPMFQNLLRLCIPEPVWLECLNVSCGEFSTVTEFLQVLDTLKHDPRFTSQVLRLTYGVPMPDSADYAGIGVRPVHPILDTFPSEGPIFNHMRLLLPDFYPQGVPGKLDQRLPPVCSETRDDRNKFRMSAHVQQQRKALKSYNPNNPNHLPQAKRRAAKPSVSKPAKMPKR